MITYAHGTTGIADQCAPSRDGPARARQATSTRCSGWLKAGYAVVRTDYEGLGTPGVHPYLIGRSEGRGVLDIVRAARQLDPRIGKQRRDLRPLAGRPRRAVGGVAGAEVHARAQLRGTVALRAGSHLAEQARLISALHSPSG